jgi:hypothetical protein
MSAVSRLLHRKIAQGVKAPQFQAIRLAKNNHIKAAIDSDQPSFWPLNVAAAACR